MSTHATDSGAPPFGEAKASLERFLGEQGWPGRVVWVFREDVIDLWGKIWVQRSEGDDAERERLAANLYEVGRARGPGVLMSACVRFPDAMGCYVWYPADDNAARYALMPRGLKLSVLDRPFAGVEVRSRRWWACLRWWNDDRTYVRRLVGDFPSRWKRVEFD
jgi:hypothetical protein